MMKGMDNDAFMTMFREIDKTADWLKPLDAIVNGALARLYCVGMSGGEDIAV